MKDKLIIDVLMYIKDNDDKSMSCWWDAYKTELRFFILIFSLQRQFTLIDLDRDWIGS